MDGRTQEQREADEALTKAVQKCVHAYSDDIEPTLLTDYVVIAASYMPDGLSTMYSTIYSEDNLPAHRAMGLIEYARRDIY